MILFCILDSCFEAALKTSKLANELKNIYENIRKSGIVDNRINDRIRLSFCLPHLAYNIAGKCEQSHFVEVVFDAIQYFR